MSVIISPTDEELAERVRVLHKYGLPMNWQIYTTEEVLSWARYIKQLEDKLRVFAVLLPEEQIKDMGGGTIIAPEIKVRWIKEAQELLRANDDLKKY